MKHIISNVKITNNKFKVISILRDGMNIKLKSANDIVNSLLEDKNNQLEVNDSILANLLGVDGIEFDYDKYHKDTEIITIKIKSKAELWFDSLNEEQQEFVKELSYNFVPGPAQG